jgi:hypothetical protein
MAHRIHTLRHALAGWRALLLAAATWAGMGSAHALGDAAWGYSYDFTHDWIQADLVRRSAQASRNASQAGARAGSAADAPSARTRRSALDLASVAEVAEVAGAGGTRLSDTRAAELLARRLYPREQFLPRKGMFEDLIVAFNRSVVKQYGIAPNHLASGMAMALAGGWSAYTGRPFPDAAVKPLVAQLDRALQGDAAIGAMSARDKLMFYHLMVGSGMWLLALQIDLGQQPDRAHAARLNQLGADYLQSLVGVPPERLRFGAQGLQIQ